MFCVSNRPLPTYPPHPAAIFIPTAGVASMMPCKQTPTTHFRSAAALPPLSTTRCCEQLTAHHPACFDGLSPTPRHAAVPPPLPPLPLRETTVSCMDATTGASSSGGGVTSFRIADILDWPVGASARRVPETTAVDERRRRTGVATRCIVRPWDRQRPSSSTSASPSMSASSSSDGLVEERISDDDDDDDDVADVDVVDASCSRPAPTSSSSSSDHEVCPLGALLRMTNQTNFDECANRLQQCFTDGTCRMLLIDMIYSNDDRPVYRR